MRVALMHYHLRAGGVSTVIGDQYRALASSNHCIVFVGEPPANGEHSVPPDAVRVVRGIGYAATGEPPEDPRDTAARVLETMREEWGAPADVLHVHNPTLKKNPAFLRCLRILQEYGVKLLVQIHDLAEDGRPESYYSVDESYPEDCHYAVINSRDLNALLGSGLEERGVHLMFNEVRARPARALPAVSSGRSGFLYPVRAIRRKNIGEALLLSVLFDEPVTITLPPRNRDDVERYEEWRRFSRGNGIRVTFGAGLEQPLDSLWARSSASLTTSTKEGFGFAFLEPWLAGIAVTGRRLSHVCRDFEDAGMRLPYLYDELPVPLKIFEAGEMRARWERAFVTATGVYGREIASGTLSDTWNKRTEGGSIDFGFLDETAQREVIARVQARNGERRKLRNALGFVADVMTALGSGDPAVLGTNQRVVAERYGSEAYARLISDVYGSVCGVPVRQKIDRRRLVDFYLDPGEFRILGTR